MKIAYLSTFYPFRGGIAQFNANLTQAFQAMHEVIPFTFKRQYPDILFPGKTQYVTEDDSTVVLETFAVLDTVNPFTYELTARKIIAAKPDLLVMKYWMSFFAPSLGWVARRARQHGIRVVTILDNVIPHEKKFFDKPLTSWFLRQNSGFVAMSEAVRDDLLTLRPDAHYILKPHPLYNHFGQKENAQHAKEKLGLDPHKKTLLFFGLIRDYKGLDLLIDAMAALDEDYQLLIAGESYGSFDKYAGQIRRIPHPENIHVFNRYIADTEVPAFFSAADVCILPYKSATQSGITSIAYHFDVPLIATDTGGLREGIGTPGTGLIVPQINAQSIAATIRQFYASNRQQFVDRIRQQKNELSWDGFAEALLSLAEKV